MSNFSQTLLYGFLTLLPIVLFAGLAVLVVRIIRNANGQRK